MQIINKAGVQEADRSADSELYFCSPQLLAAACGGCCSRSGVLLGDGEGEALATSLSTPLNPPEFQAAP